MGQSLPQVVLLPENGVAGWLEWEEDFREVVVGDLQAFSFAESFADADELLLGELDDVLVPPNEGKKPLFVDVSFPEAVEAVVQLLEVVAVSPDEILPQVL